MSDFDLILCLLMTVCSYDREKLKSIQGSHRDSASTHVSSTTQCGAGVGGPGGWSTALYTKFRYYKFSLSVFTFFFKSCPKVLKLSITLILLTLIYVLYPVYDCVCV